MRTWITYAAPILLIVAIIGCTGGRKDLPTTEAAGDSTNVFIFAESPLMNIDSEMMSLKLATIQIPGEVPVIDSVKATKAVYEILADSLLTEDAEHFDLKHEDSSLYQQYLDLFKDRVMRKMYLDLIVDSVNVSDSAVQAQYEADKESYHVPDKYRAQHIVVSGEGLRYSDDSATYKEMSTEQLDSAAHAKVEELRQRLVDGVDFDTLAMLYSQDRNTGPHGGDLGYFELVQMVAPFDSTVEHTPKGEISGVIKTRFGWHVLRVNDFIPAHYSPLDSVYAQIEYDLKQQDMLKRSRNFIDSLREAANIVYDTAAIMMPDSLRDPDTPLMLINPQDTVNGNDTVYVREYRVQEPKYRGFYGLKDTLSLDDKLEILKGTATPKLLVEATHTLGYYQAELNGEWSRNKLIQYSKSILRQRLLNAEYEPSDEEMRAYYDSHLEDYRIDRPVKVQHIVFQDSALAEYVRDLLTSGVDFMDMVDKYYPGDPDIRRAAADLGNIGPKDMPESFYRAAMYTPVGSISHPVKTQYGYHLIKVLDRAYSREFEQAKAEIRPILVRRHEREVLRSFVVSRLGQPPKIHFDLLSQLKFPVPDLSNSSPIPPGVHHSP